MLPDGLPPPASRDETVWSVKASKYISASEHRKFHLAYNTASFGYVAASMLVRAGRRRFPIQVNSRSMNWVYKTFLLQLMPHRYRNDPEFEAIKEAIDLFQREDSYVKRQIVESALLTYEMKPHDLGAVLGMNGQTVEAYDALFYNVTDRKADHMFLRELVYPFTRLEEQLEEYLTKGNVCVQLKRIGYNKGLLPALHFAGFRTEILNGMDEPMASGLFNRAVMMQGWMLAEHGFLNFSKQHPSIMSAKAIVQSRLIGGQDRGEVESNSAFGEAAMDLLYKDSAALQQRVGENAGIAGNLA